MKKVLLLCMMVCSFALLFTGCSQPEDEVQLDLYSFITEDLSPIQKKQNDLLSQYNQYYNVEKVDNEALKQVLEATVIPEYTQTVEDVKAIHTETPEVMDLRDKYVEASQIQLDAFTKMLEALQNEDEDALAEANQLIDDAQYALTSYESELKILATEHNITITTSSDSAN